MEAWIRRRTCYTGQPDPLLWFEQRLVAVSLRDLGVKVRSFQVDHLLSSAVDFNHWEERGVESYLPEESLCQSTKTADFASARRHNRLLWIAKIRQ